jgi:hypothetical protein
MDMSSHLLINTASCAIASLSNLQYSAAVQPLLLERDSSGLLTPIYILIYRLPAERAHIHYKQQIQEIRNLVY